MDINLRSEISNIRDFHYLALPILNPILETVDRFEVPEFHWELYEGFDHEARKQLTVAPVGFAKSTILKIWGLYQFLQQKDPYILYVSSTFGKATDQFGGIKKILEQKFLQVIYQYKILSNNETEVVIQFIDQSKQKFESIAAGADISGINFEGQRPTLILIDDLEELDQAKSKDRTDKLQEWLFTTLISRLPSLTSGRVRMINTVLTLDSLTNRILGKAPNFDKLAFSDWHINFYQALKDGKSIWEEMHPTDALLKEKELNPHIFAANYMNEPMDLSDSLIKLENLRFYEYINGNMFDKVYLHADTTHTGKEHSDYFCLVVMGEHRENHNYYVLDFVLERLDVEQQARKAIGIYLIFMQKVKKFTYDEKANQGFGYWVKELAKREYNVSLPIEELKYSSDKISHFLPHQPHFIANRVYLPSKHKDIALAMSQLLAFPSQSINDDFVDGLSGCLDNYAIQKSFGFAIG